MARNACRSGCAILFLLPLAAHAHAGPGHGAGFMQGLLHPLSGIDHAFALIASGVLAATIARWVDAKLPFGYGAAIAASLALAAAFGLLHGHAHAAAMLPAGAVMHAAGVGLATLLLHGLGIGLASVATRVRHHRFQHGTR